ncbi:MAG: PEP-CTERM sorting domain-containing protein [Bryobacteraceae bacterium]
MRNGLRLCGLLLAASPALWASGLCSSLVTLQDYINQGIGGCQFGNAIFSNFSYTYNLDLIPGNPDNVDPNVTASEVQVTASGSAFSPVLNFQAVWTASDGFLTQIDIGYTVSVPPALPIEGTSVAFSGTVEDLGPDPPYAPSDVMGTINFSTSLTTLNPSLYPSTCPPLPNLCSAQGATNLNGVQQVTVGDLITLNSGGANGSSPNTATLSDFQQTFSEIPEPSTLLAAGLGLLVCGWLAARKTRRA